MCPCTSGGQKLATLVRTLQPPAHQMYRFIDNAKKVSNGQIKFSSDD